MGNAGSAILWNSAPHTEMVQFRRQPVWSYYSQVSIASPHGRVVDRPDTHLYAIHGLVPDAISETAGTPAAADGGNVVPIRAHASEPAKSEGKQWGPWSLTQRELEVLQLLTEGATNSDISGRLFISPKTTKNHLAAIFQKLDVTNRTQALVRAVVMGLVSIE